MKWVHPFYLGVQGYGCIRAEDKDRFAHRFRQDDSVCCYAVCNKGRYAIQNRLQEGQAYHLTIRQETVTQAVLTRPDAQGVINAVSGNSITVDGMHLPCRAMFGNPHTSRRRCRSALLSHRPGLSAVMHWVFGRVAYIRPAPQMYHPPVHGVPGQRTLQRPAPNRLDACRHRPVRLRWRLEPAGYQLRQHRYAIGLPQSWIDFSTVRTPAMPTATTAIPRTATTRPAAGTSTAMPVWIAQATLAGRCTIPYAYRGLRLSPAVTAMSRPPPGLPIRLPKGLGYPFPSGLRQRPAGAVPRSVRRYLQHGRSCVAVHRSLPRRQHCHRALYALAQ